MPRAVHKAWIAWTSMPLGVHAGRGNPSHLNCKNKAVNRSPLQPGLGCCIGRPSWHFRLETALGALSRWLCSWWDYVSEVLLASCGRFPGGRAETFCDSSPYSAIHNRILRFILGARGALGAQNMCARLARANHTIPHSRLLANHDKTGAKELGHGWDVFGIWMNRRIG